MRTRLLNLCLTAVGCHLLACSGADESTMNEAPMADEGSSTSGTDEPTASGMGVAPSAQGEEGFDPDYQTSDAFFTRISTPMQSGVHALQRTWYSENLAELPRTGPFQAPVGSVAIKAEYDQGGENFTTVVMIKQEPGYDPDGNDWYYEARNPDGSLASSPTPGPAALCKGCHSSGSDTDFLLGFDLEN